MRTLALGDIHGCLTALKTLEEFVPFTPEDRIVALGDFVDRGPRSRQVVDWLIARYLRGALIPIRGNHEIMMCAARRDLAPLGEWLSCGGDRTLDSYAPPERGGSGRLADVPDSHWEFLRSRTLAYYETRTHFFVHAGADYDVPLDQQADYTLYWLPFNNPPPHHSGKIMVCGHTVQRDGRPRSIGHAVCIDTWVYGDGYLTCLDVQSGEYWQANERGETRRGSLE